MSNSHPLEQLRILFDSADIARIKTAADEKKLALSFWVEEAIKERLENGFDDKVFVRRGREQLRIRVPKVLIDEILDSGPVPDLKIWIKEAIYSKLES